MELFPCGEASTARQTRVGLDMGQGLVDVLCEQVGLRVHSGAGGGGGEVDLLRAGGDETKGADVVGEIANIMEDLIEQCNEQGTLLLNYWVAEAHLEGKTRSVDRMGMTHNMEPLILCKG